MTWEMPKGEVLALAKTAKLLVLEFDGVLTDNLTYIFETGDEAVRCCSSDGTGLRMLEKAGIETLVLTANRGRVVAECCSKMGVPCIQGADDKLKALEELAETRKRSLDDIAFIARDSRDLPCLKAIGFPIAVRDADVEVLPWVRCQTRARGGMGAVREVANLFQEALVPELRREDSGRQPSSIHSQMRTQV